MRRLLGPLLAVALAGCFAVATTPSGAPGDPAPGTWRALAPMPSERQEVAVAAAGGRVYVIGGFGGLPGLEPAPGRGHRLRSGPVTPAAPDRPGPAVPPGLC